jgi:hypothetical protein
MTHTICTFARRAALPLLFLSTALSWPASAPAAVTIGSSLPEPTGELECYELSGCTLVQPSLGSQPQGSPVSGVIVRWRMRLPLPSSVGGGGPRLHLVHPTDEGRFRGGQRGLSFGANEGVRILSPGLPVAKGDIVGIDLDMGERVSVASRSVFDSSLVLVAPLLQPGETRPPTDEWRNLDLLLNADIEPDADGDFYGDETQDQCPQLRSYRLGCPGSANVRITSPHSSVVVGGDVSFSIATLAPRLANGHLRVRFGPELVPRTVPADCALAGAEVSCPLTDAPRAIRVITATAVSSAAAESPRSLHRAEVTAELILDSQVWRRATAQLAVLPAGRCVHVMTELPRDGLALVGTITGDFMTGTQEADLLLGHEGDDCLSGLSGADRLHGSKGADRLTGGEGADRLTGGPEADRYYGGPGSDVVKARDGVREFVRCGRGQDFARLDRRDRAIGCERIRRP